MRVLAAFLVITILVTVCCGCQSNKPAEVVPGEDATTATTTTTSAENQGDSAPSEEAVVTTTTSATTTTAPTTTTKPPTTTTQKPTTTTKITDHTNSQAEIDAATKLLEDNVTDEQLAAMESRKNAPCRYCGQQRDERHHCYTCDMNCPDCGEFVKRLECHFCG